MTPNEVKAKHYECFNTGDMETFISLYHDDVVVTIELTGNQQYWLSNEQALANSASAF